ncbi:HAMP domain-containing histidine kinase [Variovorax sp. S2]|uniref:sensor histidine kinase n=1 Tax=Variovorax sp. S12S4 TaxID=3029170 RepID=UPI00215CACAD|nr:HAMP domain-containing histidine kinase [Variovorax sp. S12S4]MCR8959827.1 HAMP domain-containing histidine kinase [Variovorax sp. S12S4]
MRFAKLHWPHSLGTRLLATYVAGILVCIGLIVVVSAAKLLLSGDTLNEGISTHARLIARQLQFDATGRPSGLNEPELPTWLYSGMGKETSVRVLDATGNVVMPAGQSTSALLEEGKAFAPREHTFDAVSDGLPVRAATHYVDHAGHRWYVQVAVSRRLIELMDRSVGLPALGQGILVACLASVLVFAVAMYFTLGRMLRPLRVASESAARITPRTLGARLSVQGLPSEMLPLIEAFNRALDRLQSGYMAQQDFLAAAAHELKTPLSLIRGQVELGGDSDAAFDRGALIRDVDQMARHVSQLLHLAEATELCNYDVGQVGAAALVDEVGDYLGRLAARREVHLDLRVAPDVVSWQADRGALFTLLKNLLENAIQHSPSHGVVRLRADARRISVCDEGAGIPAGDLPMIFDRFWRGAGRRDEGAGLGLAICREIALAHGWRLTAHAASPGTDFVLAFAP